MISYGLQGLAALGLDLPADPDNEMVQRALKEVDQLLANRQISDLLDDPPATDERAMVRTIPIIPNCANVVVFKCSVLCCQVIQKLISKMAVGYYFVKPNAYTLALATGVRLPLCCNGRGGGNNNQSLTFAYVLTCACVCVCCLQFPTGQDKHPVRPRGALVASLCLVRLGSLRDCQAGTALPRRCKEDFFFLRGALIVVTFGRAGCSSERPTSGASWPSICAKSTTRIHASLIAERCGRSSTVRTLSPACSARTRMLIII